MATMVKEKRREKKKAKEKPKVSSLTEEISLNISETFAEGASTSKSTNTKLQDVLQEIKKESAEKVETCSDFQRPATVDNIIKHSNKEISSIESGVFPKDKSVTEQTKLGIYKTEKNVSGPQILQLNPSTICEHVESTKKEHTTVAASEGNVSDCYQYLNVRLEMIAIPNSMEAISEARELELSDPNAYLISSTQIMHESECIHEHGVEDIIPSAPMFQEEIQPQVPYQQQEEIKDKKPKVQCMSLEEAVIFFGGAEIAAVKVMSEREEAIVEAGPVSSPEHPLIDLLSTFKSSLRAMENERSKLACSFADEEKYRASLWKIEKRNIYQKKECICGTSVELKAKCEHATLMKERLPVARLRLESLLRDVQDSFCHHQHAALLAYCQIEEFISETVEGNKNEIRTALSLVLQALRVSEGAAAALSAALRRWAAALAAALVDERDVRQLLFVLHHLFRQSHSVRWAARVLQTRVSDAVSAARALALLDTLLASPRLDAAVECTEAEDTDEAWEEVSARGCGGAVSEGALREIDLLALFHVFPLRDLVARVLLFTHADIRQARPYEWGDASGGRGVLKACCGVRALLAMLQRAAAAHAQYARLNAKLRGIAAAAMEALACLYQSPRAPYQKDLEERIAAELEACFTAGFALFGARDLHKLPTTLLTEDAAKDYCLTFIVGLHEKSAKQIESLSVEAPPLPCAVRVRIVSHAVIGRGHDHELARIILEFLFQTGAKIKSTSCKAGCVAAARECLPRLLAAHPYLHAAALHTVASLAQVESIDPLVVDMLHVNAWRPQCEELLAVLNNWAQRCPQLLQHLLLQLDYTPFTGLALPAQLSLGSWLCARFRSHPAHAELYWRVLLRLRTHRVCWRQHTDAPAPDPEPTDAFSNAYAVLSSSWGHCIPLICSSGVSALCALVSRPREAVHCLAPVMLLMAHSPESVSLTPRFTELFSALLTTGPTLVQRALGRGGAAGPELLLRLVLTQLEGEQCGSASRVSVLSAWLHGLWRVSSPAAAAVLDTAALAAREWPTMDAHAALLLQEESAKEHVANAVRNAATAPLLCECLLRAYHTHRELNTRTFGAVSNILWEQRINSQRIHVDNALQKINASISSEELVIYRCATAALAAPFHHPSHLALWRLFFHLYLQRPPNNMQDTAVPVGPLFFSGLIKSRTLTQIKKRLEDTATYHHSEAETYKTENTPSRPSRNRVVKSESLKIDKGLLPALTIKDLTGESSESSDSDSDVSEESEGDSKVEERRIDDDESYVEKKLAIDMACYHTAAERMVREFCTWINEGDRVRASPHHADIARFIPEQALEAAWKNTLSRSRPPPSPDLDEFPRPAPPPSSPPEQRDTPLDVAVNSIMRIKDRSGTRSRRLIRSPLDDVDYKDTRSLLSVVDKHLKVIDTLAKEWCSEVCRISSLDSSLWDLVAVLRVPRPLPPVTRPCTNTKTRCKPVVFHIEEREWCISTGAEQGIRENRSAALAGIRRLARPRPLAARTSAALHSIARRIRDGGAAMCVVERAWRAAAQCVQCTAAHAALTALVEEIAERWICHDGRLVAETLSRWCARDTSALQQALCGALVCPRRVATQDWPLVYTALLNAKLPPHTIFSYLSKFEMSHWSKSAGPGPRHELLSALLSAHSRHGPAPAPAHSILLELLGMHTTALINDQELCSAVMQFARAAVDGKLPPQQWMHLLKAVESVGDSVPFDQLGHLLRDLGALWWEARSAYNGATTLVPHAAHIASLLHKLLRTFVDAGVRLSYDPERVGQYAWSALQESWGAWIAPHPSTPPLLPSLAAKEGHYTPMLQSFVDCLQKIMLDCPGCSVTILQLLFEWCAHAHAAAQAAAARQEGRVQASELLAQLARLPWNEHQWFYGKCLQLALQMCATNDKEILSWSSDAWGGADAVTLLRDVTDDTLAPRLASLLYLFTGTPLRHRQHILDEATRLPWWRLPEPALGEALDRFFAVHHDPSQAYHDLPQFQVLLFGSEVRTHARTQAGAETRGKRARALSQWTRAAAAPALLHHVHKHTDCVLRTLTDLAPYLDEAGGELEELFGRASIVMCMEPAAAAALPVWQQWVSGAGARAACACVSAACALTAPQYCAALSDTAVKALLARNESGWTEAVRRWSASSPWREAHVFVSRACLHAAYVCALAHTPPTRARPVLAALQTATTNFVDNEVIVAVWICYACRVALECATSTTSEAEECRHAAQALLAAWAQPPRRSILRVVTLQADTERTTALHRLLCRLAECILSPSSDAVQAYETACIAAPGSNEGVLGWGQAATPRRLPTLAVRLYPKHERYFKCEMDATPET